MYVQLPIAIRELTVLRITPVTPKMIRLTVGGPQLRAFSNNGYDLPPFETRSADDHVKMVFPDPQNGQVSLPTQDDGRLDWPKDPRSIFRDYSVRRFDPDAGPDGEVDIDFVLHDHGVAGVWAGQVSVGDTAYVAGPRGSHLPDVEADWWLLVADETGLPAVGRFIEEFPDKIGQLTAIVIVDGPEEEQRDLPGVTYVHRDGQGASDPELLATAVRQLPRPTGRGWGWVAGEAAVVKTMRGVFTNEFSLSKDQINASGYWRSGETNEDVIDAKERADARRSARQLPRAMVTVLGTALLLLSLTLSGCAGSKSEPAEAATGEATRVITTDEGEVEIPAEVERVVTTHNIATQPLIDLGVTPVGIGAINEGSSYPNYWEKVSGIEQVTDTNGAAKIEQIAELVPDVIFATNMTEDAVITKLQQIAPVIQIGIDGEKRTDWQGRAELVAEVVSRQSEAKALQKDFDMRAAKIKKTYADSLSETTVNVLDSYEPNTVTPYSPTSMVGSILTAAGAQFAASGRSPEVASKDSASQNQKQVEFTFEDLDRITDGELILHGSQVADGNRPTPTQQKLISSKLFQASAAAKAGHVRPIGKTTIAGYGDAFGTLALFEAALEKI